MSNLKSLNAKGRVLVDNDFLSGSNLILRPEEAYLDKLDRSLNLEEFHALIETTMKNFAPFGTEMDGYMAPRLHQALRLTPREAGNIGVWHYLSVVEVPEFVRHRWKVRKNGTLSKERFLGDFVRNTFSRLWWGAELTVKSERDYSLTEGLFAKTQDLYEAVFGRSFSRYPPATRAFLSMLGSEAEDLFRLVAKNLTHVLTTVVLENMDEAELETLLGGLLQDVK